MKRSPVLKTTMFALRDEVEPWPASDRRERGFSKEHPTYQDAIAALLDIGDIDWIYDEPQFHEGVLVSPDPRSQVLEYLFGMSHAEVRRDLRLELERRAKKRA
jgi:hypothetical protein